MMLPALLEYERRKLLEDSQFEVQTGSVPSGYQRQPIKGFVDLDNEGRFLRFQPTAGTEPKNDKGRVFVAPHVMRSSAIRPKLLADNAEYALGISKGDGTPNPKVANRHEAFIAALQDCLLETGNRSVAAVVAYLTETRPPLPIWEGFDPTLNYSFTVEGHRPFEDADVQEYWASKIIGSRIGEGERFSVESLITGEIGTVMTAEPVKIKGIPGGQQAGMNLVSANAPAFLSYGLDAPGQAPILAAEAEQYANGLNRLLRDTETHYRIGQVVYTFWTREGPVPPVSEALTAPAIDFFGERTMTFGSSPSQVRRNIVRIWSAGDGAPVSSTDFYAAGLSASGSRVVIRSFLHSTVSELIDRLTHYFAAQQLAPWNGSNPKPQALFALAASLYRSFSKEASVHEIDNLLAFALSGARLPHTFLTRLAGRNRAERRVTYPRAVLTKMTLVSLGAIPVESMVHLEENHPDVAYQLGRLLAVLDDIQRLALGPGVNTTLADRFYGSMSTTPLSVFGRIMQGVRPHLARLRKERPAQFRRQEATLQDVVGRINSEGVPKVLTLEQQALFALGYYHQRAAIGRAIAAATETLRQRENGASSEEEN